MLKSISERFAAKSLNETVPNPSNRNLFMKFSLIAKQSALAATLAVVAAGCASSGVKNPSGVPVTEMRADERGFVGGTGVESQDIVTVADKMARGILGVPEIANAKGIPRIVLRPVLNETRFAFNKDIFLDEIKSLLNERAAGKVRFLARDRMADLEKERDLKRSGQVTSSTDPNVQQFKGADFFLTGKLVGQTTRTSAGTSDYVLYMFELIDPNTSDVIWSGSHRIKKQGLEDAVYR
jgi:PBP1b-binding outer membrane lipoprotein LpoB